MASIQAGRPNPLGSPRDFGSPRVTQSPRMVNVFEAGAVQVRSMNDVFRVIRVRIFRPPHRPFQRQYHR